ncbi:hypothetical protein FGW20_12890 [Methanoculleus sp. FWC-SCC3]|uniref:Uncharacterized protein n=1 Tax=Methanoculleus methanifontis TaxID=2584086 RepID=A0ABT8M5L0_9EURY|nr:hypothetical protein [Methanoculleus sp. FWC-SCC3]MDN7013902.1 hypothetical protein [Methanoculleus sp. FWC-SCC3]
MAAPIEPIGADSEITIQARQQQQRAQQSYTVMQQRQQQQLQQQRRQEQIRKLQVEAAARRQRAEKDRLMGWGADVKGAIDAPKTPMLAERITGMRPRDGSAPRGESLAENVAAEEERRSVEFMSGEARRAVEEEHSIAQARATRAYHMSLQAMAQQAAERRAAFEEYKKYSEDYAEAARRTDVTYSDYLKAFKAGETTQGYDEWKQPYIQQELFNVQYPDIANSQAAREEKAIKRANEIGQALAEAQIIAQTVAREGYTGATAKYGRDPQELIAEQKARAAAAQTSLQQNFNILPDPRHQEYFKEVSDFAARQRGVVSLKDSLTDQTGFRIGRAEMSLKTSDYPAPPSSTPLYDAAVKTGLVTAPVVGGTEKIQAVGSGWIEENRAATHRVIDQIFPDNGIPKTVAGGMAEIGTGGWRALLGIQSMGLAVPAAEYAARHPQEFFAALAPGTAKYATDLATHATQHPLQFGGELAAGALVFHGGAKVTGRVTAPITSRITEFGIRVRTPSQHRPAIGAISDIGRNVPELRSTIEADPDLSQILNIGKAAPAVEEVLTKQPHTIFGSATQIGQMPAKRIPATPKDLDVFVSNPEAFNLEMTSRLGPEYSIEGNVIRRSVKGGKTPHAIDTHTFPEGYPISGQSKTRIVYQEEQVAPNLPFEFMPKEVLRGGRLTQEYLYTQTLRKATSVMGEPESLFRWKFGPPKHRMKDIPTLIADAEWLVESTKQRVPQMRFIERIIATRKIRKIERGLDVLRKDPLVVEAMEAAPATDSTPSLTVFSRAPQPRQPPAVALSPGSPSLTVRSGPAVPEYFSSRPPSRPPTYPASRPPSYPRVQPRSRPPVYSRSRPPSYPPGIPRSRPPTYPASRPPSYPPGIPRSRPPTYPASRPPSYPPGIPRSRPPSHPPSRPPSYPPGVPPTPPPSPPPGFFGTSTTRQGRRPWYYDKYRRREVVAPIASPWELLGVKEPAWFKKETARIATSRPQRIFVADQRRIPVASKQEAGLLEDMFSAKRRKKTLFW